MKLHRDWRCAKPGAAMTRFSDVPHSNLASADREPEKQDLQRHLSMLSLHLAHLRGKHLVERRHAQAILAGTQRLAKIGTEGMD